MTAKKNGEAIITVKVSNYPSVSDTCKVFVSNNNINVESIKMVTQNTSLDIGKNYQIKYNLYPKNSTIHELEFISSNEEIATVNTKGIVTSKSVGSVTIKVLDKISKKYDTMTIDVKEKEEEIKKEEVIKVKELSLLLNKSIMEIGETSHITAKIYPEQEKNIEWESSDKNIVLVDNLGNIKAIKDGVATITAKIDGIAKSIFIVVNKKEEKAIEKEKKTYIAVFDSNTTLSCETEGDSCKVVTPVITKDGYEILGWSTSKNSHRSSFNVNEEITLTKNEEYYSVTRKKISVNFVLQDEKLSMSGGNNTCYIYNNETSCNVTSPTLKSGDRTVAIGWSDNKNSNVARVNSDETFSIKTSTTYYSVSVNRTYLTATFKIQDINAIKESSKEVVCEITANNSCTVVVPSLTANLGYTIIGWNTNKNAISSDIKAGDKIVINSDMTYYSITKKSNPLKVTFIIQNNTADKTDEKTSCELYNGMESCKITVPSLIGKNNNVAIGWNTNKNATTSLIKGQEEITIDKNITYYSITKGTKKLTANFQVVTPSLVKADKEMVSCDIYNGLNSCEVETPELIKLLYNVTPIGWTLEKNDTKNRVSSKTKIKITKDTTYYSIISQVITITYTIGDNVEGKNIKAEKLSYNYTDASGNTIIKEEGQTLKTTCVSYNGNGCKIDYIPTIYSKGNIISGFSKSSDGDVLVIYDIVFKEDTTLYSRVGYRNKIIVDKPNIGFQKVYGNVVFEAESKLPSADITSMQKLLDTAYKYYPEMFYYNGKIIFLTKNTYSKIYKPLYSNISNTAAITFSGYGFSTVCIAPSRGTTGTYYLHSAIHEIGHAINYLYYYSFGTHISKTQSIIDLYNKYKNAKDRPLRSYAYSNDAKTEFVSEALSETIRVMLYEKENKYPYKLEGKLTDDIKNVMKGFLADQHKFLVSKGRIK